MKKTLKDIAFENNIEDYDDLYNFIIESAKKGDIEPIKASKTNGKKPSLYNKYRVLESKVDFSEIEHELKYELNSKLSCEYYLKHLDMYQKDREEVLKFNNYLYKNGSKKIQISVNERSFEIWHKEKFLTKGSGKKILKRLGVKESDLNMYETSEPLSYYSNYKDTPQNILIIENKDTFYTFRKALIEGYSIFGYDIGTLIYGAGKGVHKVFKDIHINAEEYMLNSDNDFYYFGDMDYEGLGIYELLKSNVKLAEDVNIDIKVFKEAYEKMLLLANEIDDLPKTAEGQKEGIYDVFYSYFDESTVNEIKEILKNRDYIPQEIITMEGLTNA